jgi:hypothetical protein
MSYTSQQRKMHLMNTYFTVQATGLSYERYPITTGLVMGNGMYGKT